MAAAEHADRLAQQGLGCRRAAGRDDHAAAFIAYGHGFIDPAGHGPHELGRHIGGDDGGFA